MDSNVAPEGSARVDGDATPENKAKPTNNAPLLNRARMGANVVVLAIFVGAALASVTSLESPTYWFPAFVSVAGCLAAAGTLIADFIRMSRGKSLTDGEIIDVGATIGSGDDGDGQRVGGQTMRRRVFTWAGWLLALPLLGLIIPFFFASLFWLFLVFKFQAKKSWLFTVVAVVCFGIALNVAIVLLDLGMPTSLFLG